MCAEENQESADGNHRPRRHQIADWLYDFWLESILIATSGLMAAAGLVYSDEFTNLIGVGRRTKITAIIVFLAVGTAQFLFSVLNLRRAKRVSALEENLAKCAEKQAALIEDSSTWVEDIYAICQGHIRVLGSHSELQLKTSDRISLYAHDKRTSTFLLLARFSPHEVWGKPARKSYPDNQGCIGRAWVNGEHHIMDYPDRDGATDEYLRRSAEYDIPEKLALELRMPSRFYFGWRVRDLSGTMSLAVLIIESTIPRRFQLGDLQEMFAGHAGYHLRDLMQLIAPRIPSQHIATEAGF